MLAQSVPTPNGCQNVVLYLTGPYNCVTRYRKFSGLHDTKLSSTISMIRNLTLGFNRWK